MILENCVPIYHLNLWQHKSFRKTVADICASYHQRVFVPLLVHALHSTHGIQWALTGTLILLLK